MIATPSSYIGNLVDKVGANNIVKDDKKPFVSYSNEEIVKLNPDMVLVMTHGMPEQAKKWLKKNLLQIQPGAELKLLKKERSIT